MAQASKVSKSDKRGWAWVGAVCGIALVASFLLEPGTLNAPTICLFKRTTGLDCLGCGLTRGFVWVSHGEFSKAMKLNSLVAVVYPLFIVLVFVAGLKLGGVFPEAWRVRLPESFYVIFAVLLCSLWAWRLITP